MQLKTSKITTSVKDKFIKGIIMALYNENIILSEAERSLYEFILSKQSLVGFKQFNRRTSNNRTGIYWYLWELKNINI